MSGQLQKRRTGGKEFQILDVTEKLRARNGLHLFTVTQVFIFKCLNIHLPLKTLSLGTDCCLPQDMGLTTSDLCMMSQTSWNLVP